MSAAIDGVSALVAKKRVGEPVQRNQGDVDPVQTQQHVSPSSAQNQHPEARGGLKNPTRQKPKGRPKASEKRKKPLVEQLEDEAKKKQKKDEDPKKPDNKSKKKRKTKIKCAYCLGEHPVSDCQYLKAADARDAAGLNPLQHVQNVTQGVEAQV